MRGVPIDSGRSIRIRTVLVVSRQGVPRRTRLVPPSEAPPIAEHSWPNRSIGQQENGNIRRFLDAVHDVDDDVDIWFSTRYMVWCSELMERLTWQSCRLIEIAHPFLPQEVRASTHLRAPLHIFHLPSSIFSNGLFHT